MFVHELTPVWHNDKGVYDGDHKQYSEETASDLDPFTALAIEEEDHDIKYRTLSWQKAALLLFGEYVCLAILALAWSWSVLGWVSVARLDWSWG